MSPTLDHERCYRAVAGRDARFDGWFFTAVRTTGIYCRPSCPARTPLARNVSFFTTAAAAQAAGYRACRRCRPDAVPGSPEWDVRADVVARAMRLIADGAVERSGVPGLAAHLGYSERQLNRLLVAELGVGPLALARAQRAQTARVLIETTDLSMADVAFAAGFASIRQFNDTVREVFATTPSASAAQQPRGRRGLAGLAHPPARRPRALRRRRGAALPRRACGARPRGVGRDDVLARPRPAARAGRRAALPCDRRRRRRHRAAAAGGAARPRRRRQPMPPDAGSGRRPGRRGRRPRGRPRARARWWPAHPAVGCPPPPMPTSWRSGPSSASRSRWPAPAPSPPEC